jgi:hypothetical protein
MFVGSLSSWPAVPVLSGAPPENAYWFAAGLVNRRLSHSPRVWEPTELVLRSRVILVGTWRATDRHRLHGRPFQLLRVDRDKLTTGDRNGSIPSAD